MVALKSYIQNCVFPYVLNNDTKNIYILYVVRAQKINALDRFFRKL